MGALEIYSLDFDRYPEISSEENFSILKESGALEANIQDTPRQKVSNLRSDKFGNVWCLVHGPYSTHPVKVPDAYEWAMKFQKQLADFPMVEEARNSMK
jgi:hypothetical protein